MKNSTNYVQEVGIKNPDTILTTGSTANIIDSGIIITPGNCTISVPSYTPLINTPSLVEPYIPTYQWTGTSSSYLIPINSLTLNQIISERKKCKSLPHPCMAFFLEMFRLDKECKGFYNGDHIIIKYKDYWFDIHGEVSNINGYSPLQEYGLGYFINAFPNLDKNQLKLLIDAI